ncbi:hypothetical protein [Streptosporangium sp. NPDC004631]
MCALYRVRHSEFLGWSADDRDKAVWQHVRARQTCPHCRTRAAEWDERVGGHRHAYVARETRCRGCEVVESKKASMDGTEGRGVYVELRPREAMRGQPS